MVCGRHPLVSAGFLGWLFGQPRILAATDEGVHHELVLPDGQKVYIHRLHFDPVRRIDGEVVED